jgi:hypothetical protein
MVAVDALSSARNLKRSGERFCYSEKRMGVTKKSLANPSVWLGQHKKMGRSQ